MGVSRQRKWSQWIRRQRKLFILAGLAITVGGLTYLGIYFYFRINDVFVHRAGSFLFTDRTGESREIGHFIDISRVARSDQILAEVKEKMGSAGTTPAELMKMEILMTTTTASALEEERHRRRLLRFFRPAAALESLLWRIFDPDPAARQHER